LARPQAELLLERDLDQEHSIQILKGQQLWTVLYKDEPINIRTTIWSMKGPMYKYSRTAFTTESPAENLAAKLNRWFKTTDFKHRRVL
jgi:hypothetical protein